MWLTLKRRIHTKDLLLHKNIAVEPVCVLCKDRNEDIDHLFFSCSYVTSIWRAVLFNFQALPPSNGEDL